jgi:hypothetical protein
LFIDPPPGYVLFVPATSSREGNPAAGRNKWHTVMLIAKWAISPAVGGYAVTPRAGTESTATV